MYSDLEAIWQITLTRPHVIEIKNTGGFFQDKFRVIVDGIEILNKLIFLGYGSHSFILDDSLVEIRWFVNYFSGKIDSIVLMQDKIILAQYGSDRAARKTFISACDRAFLSNQNNEEKMEKNETGIMMLALLITTSIIGGGIWWLSHNFDFFERDKNPTSISTPLPTTNPNESTEEGADGLPSPESEISEPFSTGDRPTVQPIETPVRTQSDELPAYVNGYLVWRGKQIPVDWGEMPYYFQIERIDVEKKEMPNSGKLVTAITFIVTARREVFYSDSSFYIKYYDSDGIEVRPSNLGLPQVEYNPRIRRSRKRSRAFFPIPEGDELSQVNVIKLEGSP
ncbi:hypothetical protein Ple7327_2999 [Pleurocapsa sp. PCC 7327]|uniref:hypothetical protein n=1 Tax=Pleurocapsa sp. PCC 7327 TaxID=118163 RepID=UPI00029FC131|nr:hypothetical protein [Pleurocapsa sp. PCC 7327]AFY78233.1 hypothetical protein Ple7327_2999 [Pleurocapsa sp. PCC 7327]